MSLFMRAIRVVCVWSMGLAQTYVGIGTTSPTHRLHIGTGTLRVSDLNGTETVLAQADAQGVLGRFSPAPSGQSLLRGDATWGTDGSDWKLLGNANTTPSTHFVGTTDAQDFRLGVNGTTRWRILSTGNHWVGQNTTATLNNARVTVDAPSGWIAIYAQVTGGSRPAIRGTVGDNSSGPAVSAINTAANGWGAIGIGGGASVGSLPTDGGGAYGAGPITGVVGSYTGADNNRAGGAFAVRDGSGAYQWVYVGGYDNTPTQRKVWGAGTASTTVRDTRTGRYHTLFCPETPEVLLWDAGRFELTQQRQWVPIDSNLSKHIAPPYMVWVQPWGEVTLSVREISDRGFLVEADRVLSSPVVVSYLLQARRKGYEKPHQQMPAVEPTHFFTPFRPVHTYLSPDQLHDPQTK